MSDCTQEEYDSLKAKIRATFSCGVHKDHPRRKLVFMQEIMAEQHGYGPALRREWREWEASHPELEWSTWIRNEIAAIRAKEPV